MVASLLAYLAGKTAVKTGYKATKLGVKTGYKATRLAARGAKKAVSGAGRVAKKVVKRKPKKPTAQGGRVVGPSGAVTSKPGKRCDQGKKPKK